MLDFDLTEKKNQLHWLLNFTITALERIVYDFFAF